MLIHDKNFEPYISSEDIQRKVNSLAEEISRDYAENPPLLIAILNGAFIFAADLVRAMTIASEVSFIKLASYKGLTPEGKTRQLIGVNENLENRPIVIVEDIVDTGDTITEAMGLLEPHKPKSVEVAALLLKPSMLKAPVTVKYLGFEIPEQFVVGYGLDYDGLGRNLKDIYQLKEQ